MIPWLKYLPWYAQDLKRGFERNRQLNTDQLNRVKQQIVRIVLPILARCLNPSAAEQCGRRPFVREIYARKRPTPWLDRDGDGFSCW